jgi:hypothetical protein
MVQVSKFRGGTKKRRRVLDNDAERRNIHRYFEVVNDPRSIFPPVFF